MAGWPNADPGSCRRQWHPAEERRPHCTLQVFSHTFFPPAFVESLQNVCLALPALGRHVMTFTPGVLAWHIDSPKNCSRWHLAWGLGLSADHWQLEHYVEYADKLQCMHVQVSGRVGLRWHVCQPMQGAGADILHGGAGHASDNET